MIEVTKGYTDDIREEIKEAVQQAIMEKRLLNKDFTVPVKVTDKNGKKWLGVFTRFSPKDYQNYYDALEVNQISDNVTITAKDLKDKKIRGKGLFDISLDCCANAVIYPDRTTFREWGESNLTTVISVAGVIYEQGTPESQAEIEHLDFL